LSAEKGVQGFIFGSKYDTIIFNNTLMIEEK